MSELRTEVFHPPFAGLPTRAPARPVGPDWEPDVLGPGFEARTLRVPVGSGVATLVRHMPDTDPSAIPGTPDTPAWCALYLHGWNDYFFQRELARHISVGAGAFYALDLHHYGRSLREGDTPGWCASLAEFAPDIRAALAAIREDHSGAPILLIGHSTGGLTAALWAQHNPTSIDALWLTSPWLELQGGTRKRRRTHRLMRGLSAVHSQFTLPLAADAVYGTSLGGWLPEDGPVPDRYVDTGFAEDPSLTGFDLVPTWKNTLGNPIRAGWLYAITTGHGELADSPPLDLPLLLHASATSFDTSQGWSVEALSSDTVLDTDVLVAAGSTLTRDVTIRRYDCRHDPLLSFPDVRQAVWGDFHAWTSRVFSGRARGCEQLGEAACYAICP